MSSLAPVEMSSGSEAVDRVSRQESAYFGFARPELLERVPCDAARILDVGCGAGALGRSIKQRQSCVVVGIELDTAAASFAGEYLDRIIHADVDQGLELLAEDEPFDCVICGDILEHLIDPMATLRRIRKLLKPEGILVTSIPNVRHHSVVSSLLDGNWTYEPAGLLDHTHLRFFTRREVQKLLVRSGFKIDRFDYVVTPDINEKLDESNNHEIDLGRCRINGANIGDLREFFIYQFLTTARPRERVGYGLTSIIIPVHNQLNMTRNCLAVIRQVTDEPYEIIVIDNGSTDGTGAYLASLPYIRVLTNPENLGFPKAINQGIGVAQGDQILLLNNDVLVTTGWLANLLAALSSDPSVGMVGPTSNNVSGSQQIVAGYRSLSGLDGFAWDVSLENGGHWQETDRLVGFCLLMRRRVVDAIGVLDENFGLGLFDDDDYCLRARLRGFRLLIARDVYVHHFGSCTFLSLGVDTEKLLEENHRRFTTKWKRPTESRAEAIQASSQSSSNETQGGWKLVRHSQGGLCLEQSTPTVSLCMIVRDNERTIRAALASIRDYVDEMIIVDTGSKDRTPDICRELGAKVYFFNWCDDFSAARNESLSHATGDWIFWMDSDDTIDEGNARKLRQLVSDGHSSDAMAYVMQVHCPSDGDERLHDVTMVDHVKLFRNLPGVRFEGRIHEQVLQAIRSLNGNVVFTDIHVVHSGSESSLDAKAQKRDRDLRILSKDLSERPDHPFVLFNFGMTYGEAERYEEAVEYLQKSINFSDPGASHIRKAYALLVCAYTELGRLEEARAAVQKGLSIAPDDVELTFRSAIIHQHFGWLTKAEACYLKLLNTSSQRHFDSIDLGLKSFKSHHNLARIYELMGILTKAIEQWRMTTTSAPFYRLGWRGLTDCLIAAGELGNAEEAAACIRQMQLPDDHYLHCEANLILSRVKIAKNEISRAKELLENTVRRFPTDVTALTDFSRLLFEHSSSEEACSIQEKLLRVLPVDPSVLHNLGAIYLRMGRWDDARMSLEEAIRIRPNFPATAELLRAANAKTISGIAFVSAAGRELR